MMDRVSQAVSKQLGGVKLKTLWSTCLLEEAITLLETYRAQQYEALKRKLAVEFRYDRERYTDSKSPLIKQLLEKALAWQQAL